MKRIDIQDRLEELKKQLVTKYGPEKIVLFGSAAGEGEEINDIDLLIIKNDVPHFGAERIRQLYRLVNIDLPVDYLVYRPVEVDQRLSLGDPFISRIMKEGKVLHG